MINIADPKLADVVGAEFTAVMLDNLSWLDNAYGKIEKRERGFGENKYVERTKRQFYPAVANDNADYIELLPAEDHDLGNFMYMHFVDPHGIKDFGRQGVKSVYNIGVVFWYNMKKIYPDTWQNMTNENVKYEVMEAIRKNSWVNGSVELVGFDDEVENIYKGFFYEELSEQSHMKPYGGFRLNVRFITNIDC